MGKSYRRTPLEIDWENETDPESRPILTPFKIKMRKFLTVSSKLSYK